MHTPAVCIAGIRSDFGPEFWTWSRLAALRIDRAGTGRQPRCVPLERRPL